MHLCTPVSLCSSNEKKRGRGVRGGLERDEEREKPMSIQKFMF